VGLPRIGNILNIIAINDNRILLIVEKTIKK